MKRTTESCAGTTFKIRPNLTGTNPGTYKGQLALQPDPTMPHRCSCGNSLCSSVFVIYLSWRAHCSGESEAWALLIFLLFCVNKTRQDSTDKDESRLNINERELLDGNLKASLLLALAHLETFWYVCSSASVSSTWMKASTQAATGLVSSLSNC